MTSESLLLYAYLVSPHNPTFLRENCRYFRIHLFRREFKKINTKFKNIKSEFKKINTYFKYVKSNFKNMKPNFKKINSIFKKTRCVRDGR